MIGTTRGEQQNVDFAQPELNPGLTGGGGGGRGGQVKLTNVEFNSVYTLIYKTILTWGIPK